MGRLQGKEFYNLKDKLKIVDYIASSNDNIRVNLCYKTSKNGVAKYYHWLSDIEKEVFLKSDYYKNTPASTIVPKQKRKKSKKTEINDYNQDTLDLMQLYSHLGVEAFGEDIQEQALLARKF